MKNANLNTFAYCPGANADLIFARSKPTYINAAVLSAGVEAVLAVPRGASVCIFSGDGDFYVRPLDASYVRPLNATCSGATIPLETVTDGTAPELNPAQWDVHDVDRLHIIAPEDAVVTLSFYQ